MGAFHSDIASATFEAVAFQAAALAERYEEHVEQFLAGPDEPSHYEQACRDLDTLQRECLGLPALCVAGVELLIAHTDLACAVWARRVDEPLRCAEVSLKREGLMAALTHLRGRCMRQVARRK